MDTNLSWSVVAIAVLLTAACSTIHPIEESSSSVRAIYPLGGTPRTPRAPPGSGTQCPPGGPPKTCVIAVKVNDTDCRPGSVVLDEYVVLPEIGAKDRIEWRLPPGYHFCTNSGDGVFLKDPNAPQDVFEHNPRPHCSDTFEWKRKRGDRRDYEYYLRFRSASNICVKDPWMRN